VRAPLYSNSHYELFDIAASTDATPLYEVYERLRREDPISRIDESGVHLVATWALIEEALGREADFSANLTGVLIRGEEGRPGTFDLPDVGANNVIATADEPDHGVHRSMVQTQLSAARVAALEPLLRGWTQEALAPWIAKGGGDFVPISELIPARAVAHVLGLPDGDVSRFRTWAMMGGDILAGDLDTDRLIALATESRQMALYIGEHLDAATPEAGAALDADAPMLAALARGVAAGTIERAHGIGIAIVMFGAAGESTAALIGSSVRWLAENPELAEQLRSDPMLIPRFIEEVLRLESPFKFHYRAVRRPCELGGAELAPGDRLMLLWASANRDEAYFEHPSELRLDRRHPKQHMSFGRGSHFCIGAPMARLETRILLEELLTRTTSIAFSAAATARYAPSIFVRRLEELPLDVRAV
jgi:cytochrome P450